MIDRRGILSAGLVGGCWCLLTGHSPYRQWYVYRRSRLFIVTTLASHPVGDAIAKMLAQQLPESRAFATRTRYSVDAARLLGSNQFQVALLPAEEVAHAMAGEGKFRGEAVPELRVVAEVLPFALVARADYPNSQGYRLAKALTEHRGEIKVAGLQAKSAAEPKLTLAVPAHAGALAYYEGRTPPPLEDDVVLITTDSVPAHPHAPKQ